jgi:putative spermidine/putrescine transport system ATP-binding protein
MTESKIALKTNSVVKRFGAHRAVDNVDLEVGSREFVSLLGPSGCGKTSLLRLIAGFLKPDAGTIVCQGKDITNLPPYARNLGVVFQNYALFPHMDVAANIAFPLKLRGVGRGDMARRVEGALELVQLGGYGKRHIDQLSGGQRQRVALARAIVFEPRIVLMDEPLSALDKQLREAMQLELRRLHERLGTTTIYVTHDQREALTMSDRIAVINHGKVMQLDTPRRIYDRPANRFVAEFIGESAFLDVEVAAGQCRFAGRVIEVRDMPAVDGRCQLMLRPERLRILDQNELVAANVLDGTVANIVFQGDTLLLQVRLADGSAINVRGPSNEGAVSKVPALGGPIRLGLDAGDAILLPADGGSAGVSGR